MNVVFKKSVIDQIRDARKSSLMNQRDIDYIELTVKEARQLLTELGRAQPVFGELSHWYTDFEQWLFIAENSSAHIPTTPSPSFKVMGIDIRVRRTA